MNYKIKPKLIINYSKIYDIVVHGWNKLEYEEFSDGAVKYKEKLQKEWSKIERKVFNVISEVSGLKWKKPAVDCYFVRNITSAFSMPLTIPVRKDLKKQMETITHELVHNIVVQNSDRINKKDYSKKYGELSRTTNLHILIHAILKETLLKIYSEKQTKKFINSYKKPDYKKAWEIVEKEGSKKIIKDKIK